MRKKTVFCLYLLPILATMVAMNVARVNASISNVNWIGPTYRGSDTFLGTTITAYKTGSTVNVIINVHNDY